MAKKDIEYVTEEQLSYAKLLEKGMYIGLLTLLVTFVIYATGLMEPKIPLDKIGQYWNMSASDYLHKADIPAGWGWVSLLGYGDFLNFIGIALLAAVTIFCYLAVIPILLKNNDKLYAFLAGLEALILTIAASGILGAGGH